LFNHDPRHDVWRNASKTPGIVVPAIEAKVKVA